MAQTLNVTVRGTFLGSEHRAGQNTNSSTGVVEPYSYDVAHILIGMDVTHARIDEAFVGVLPKEGERFGCELRLTAYRNAGGAELAARLIRLVPVTD